MLQGHLETPSLIKRENVTFEGGKSLDINQITDAGTSVSI
jgi:hypothetical protein